MRYKYYGRKFDKDKTSNFSPEIKDIILNLMFEGVVTIGDDMFGLLRPTFANGIRRSDKIIILDSLINAKRIENQEFSDALFNIDLMDDSGIGNKNEFIEWLINLEFPGNGESEQKAETFMASFGQYLLDDIGETYEKSQLNAKLFVYYVTRTDIDTEIFQKYNTNVNAMNSLLQNGSTPNRKLMLQHVEQLVNLGFQNDVYLKILITAILFLKSTKLTPFNMNKSKLMENHLDFLKAHGHRPRKMNCLKKWTCLNFYFTSSKIINEITMICS